MEEYSLSSDIPQNGGPLAKLVRETSWSGHWVNGGIQISGPLLHNAIPLNLEKTIEQIRLFTTSGKLLLRVSIEECIVQNGRLMIPENLLRQAGLVNVVAEAEHLFDAYPREKYF